MIDNQARMQEMERRLRLTLHPEVLQLTDESHLHAGHEGAKTGKGHFAVSLASTAFYGQSTLSAHRMVYAALGDMMQTDIHALRVDTQAR